MHRSPLSSSPSLFSSSSSLLLTILLLTNTVHADVSTVLSTVTTGAASPQNTSPSTQYTDDTTFQNAILAATNFYREEHNATALTWNDTSASYAANWANGCKFQHTGGPTGENLAAGYPNVTASVDGWGTERSQYDFSKAEFSEQTGHFTQLVWKATTTVGCGRTNCNGNGGTEGWYVVCEYYPPGNVIGNFSANVQTQINGTTDGSYQQFLGSGGSGSGSSSGSGSGSGSSVHRLPWGMGLLAVFVGAGGVAAVLW